MTRWPTVVLSMAVLLLAGCAGTRTDEPPDWVSGKSSRYPDSRYLLGRGQAPQPDDARNRARADLAQVFGTTVKVETSDITKFAGPSNESEKLRVESEVARRIVTQAEQIVQGTQIAEMWQDPKTQNHHALAVLPRQQAATALRQDIERRDAATRGYVAQARNASDLLLKVAAANRALESQVARDASQKTLRVIDVTGHGVEPEFNGGQLAADLDALLKRVRIRAQAERALEPMLAGALSAAGFVPEAAGDAPFVLTGSLELDDLGVVERWYWLRGTLEVRLTEHGSGKVRGTKRWEVKVSGRDRATAQRRALDQADEILKRQLRPAIIGFATGEP